MGNPESRSQKWIIHKIITILVVTAVVVLETNYRIAAISVLMSISLVLVFISLRRYQISGSLIAAIEELI